MYLITKLWEFCVSQGHAVWNDGPTRSFGDDAIRLNRTRNADKRQGIDGAQSLRDRLFRSSAGRCDGAVLKAGDGEFWSSGGVSSCEEG